MSLPDELQAKWDEAERTGRPIEVGALVVCDFCCLDFTKSDERGGVIFESKAICPRCTPRLLASVERNGEERFVRATCPAGQTFADFVREYRGADSTIHITKHLARYR